MGGGGYGGGGMGGGGYGQGGSNGQNGDNSGKTSPTVTAPAIIIWGNGEPVASETPPAADPESPVPTTAEVKTLSADKLGSVVLIEGEGVTATGFLAKVHDKGPFVVTNLSVLGASEKLTVKTLKGDTLAWQGPLIGAKDSDIVLLKLVTTDGAPPALPPVVDISKAANGDKLVVVGNQLDGAGAIQLDAKLQSVGTSVVQVDAPFRTANRGGPVFNSAGEVLGIVSLVETAKYSVGHAKNSGGFPKKIDRRWAVYRFDPSATSWEAVDLNAWQTQMASVADYRNKSLALFALYQRRFDDASKLPKFRALIAQFQLDMKDPTILASQPTQQAAFAVTAKELFKRAQTFVDDGSKEFANATAGYYGYFRSTSKWEDNVNQQIEFRKEVNAACSDLMVDLASASTGS
jgi:hypothetical protein